MFDELDTKISLILTVIIIGKPFSIKNLLPLNKQLVLCILKI